MPSKIRIWQKIFALLLVVVVCAGCSQVPSTSYNPWEVISIPTKEKLFDIAFTGNPQHGYIVGTKSTILETSDGGETWKPVELQLDEANSRFNSVSFAGSEGWIVGEPSLLLHTTDEGRSWSRIALSEKLPGSPINIVAQGKNTAEMATNVGAIYQTTDGGKNWKAQVEEAVGVLRNLHRSVDGKYVAVSARGNFYSIWEPGQDAWIQQNRESSRRLENMGFGLDDQMWLLARGGLVQFSDPASESTDSPDWLESQYPEVSTSWGFLDLAYRTPSEIWVGGGSGNLLMSSDGGKTWEKDRDVEKVPANFYKIVFFSPEQGYIIGDRGTLLKYQPEVASGVKAAISLGS